MRLPLFCVLLIAVATAANLYGQEAKSDKEKLQGTWNVVAMQRDGRDTPAAYCQTLVVKFVGDKTTLSSKDGKGLVLEHTFKIDPTQKPRVMDLVIVSGPSKGQVLLGIYEFDGKQLKMCHADAGDRERPTSFTSPAGTFWSVVTLTRAAKE
jgi:uncharacterized protein (TIGR03067 family)